MELSKFYKMKGYAFMNYIIFGCGDIGKKALSSIGADSVLYFASNHAHENRQVCGKKVISFSEMVKKCKECRDIYVIIASGNYSKELEMQTREAGIRRYLVFSEITWPGYWFHLTWKSPACSEVIKKFNLTEYKRIGIYGEVDTAALWAFEIQRQAPAAEIFIALWGDEEPETSLVPHISLEEAASKIDCLYIVIPRCKDPIAIRDSFLLEPAPYKIIDLFEIERFEPEFHYKGLEKYKDIHKGKRIFLIGNGPSLTIEDLNTLHKHGEICMGFNKVYRAYDQTPWRADYLGFTDPHIINDCIQDIPKLPGTIFMIDSFQALVCKKFSGIEYVHIVCEEFYPNLPGFFDNLSRCEFMGYVGGSVIYTIGLQLAAYMGFQEIYLIGVDHSYTQNLTDPENHFIKNYYTADEAAKEKTNPTCAVTKSAKSFTKAEIYSRTHGFRIFNATRGGKLEAFERVDFDSLFMK